jgi:hypothetical protein
MSKASITFNTELTQDELVTRLNTNGVLGILASDLGAYPYVTVGSVGDDRPKNIVPTPPALTQEEPDE